MLKLTLAGVALALSALSPASAQEWRGQTYVASEQGGGHAPYGYGNSTSALGRDCPAGYYPHAWPDGNGIRCEPPGDSTEFISPR